MTCIKQGSTYNHDCPYRAAGVYRHPIDYGWRLHECSAVAPLVTHITHCPFCGTDLEAEYQQTFEPYKELEEKAHAAYGVLCDLVQYVDDYLCGTRYFCNNYDPRVHTIEAVQSDFDAHLSMLNGKINQFTAELAKLKSNRPYRWEKDESEDLPF